MPKWIRLSKSVFQGMWSLPNNPISGETVIQISGKEFPLVFSFDAIAKLEDHYNDSIMSAQEGMDRIEKVYIFLEAALNGAFTLEQLKDEKLPPVLVIAGLLTRTLTVAYFGPDHLDVKDPDAKKKIVNKKSWWPWKR